MRTILAAAAACGALALLGLPASAQQAPAERPPEAAGAAAAPAPAAPGPPQVGGPEGDRNPAAATASGCGTTDAELAKTPTGVDPCPAYPTPGSGETK